MPKAKKSTKTQLATRRGLQDRFMHDSSYYGLLIHADIAEVTDLLAKELKAKRVTKGVPIKDLPGSWPDEMKFFPFQYRGHAWTTVIHTMDTKLTYSPALALRLSEKLKTRTIMAGSNDDFGAIDYIMFNSGKLAEVFHWHGSKELHTPTPDEVSAIERNALTILPHGFYAMSKARTVAPEYFQSLLTPGKKFNDTLAPLIDDFFKSQDAFFALNWWGEPETETHPLAEATDEDLVRIDFIEA